jgi:hypothetical protein
LSIGGGFEKKEISEEVMENAAQNGLPSRSRHFRHILKKAPQGLGLNAELLKVTTVQLQRTLPECPAFVNKMG